MEEQKNNDLIQETLHSSFDVLSYDIEELIDSTEIDDQSKPKELKILLSSFSLPFMNKIPLNKCRAVLLSLHKKTKLEPFMALLQKIKLKNKKMTNLLVSAFQTLLNILIHTKKESVTILMLKYIIANSLFTITPKSKTILIHFLNEKCLIIPQYLEDLISIIEKSKNIYTMFICGLTLQVKTISNEQKTRLSKIFVEYFDEKVLDDEKREENIINERLLVEFLSFVNEDLFYEVIIPRYKALLLRSSKNIDFISTFFEGLSRHKYKESFIKELLETFKSFFFPNEYSESSHNSFKSIVQSNYNQLSLLLKTLTQIEFPSDKNHCYLNAINYIVTILEARNAKKKNILFSNRELFHSVTFILSNLSKTENLKEQFDNLLERLIDALVANDFKSKETISTDTLNDYNNAIDELISNNNISNCHCYLFLIISIIIEKYSIIPEGKGIEAINSYLKKNMTFDSIDENNKRNMLPLSSLALGLFNNKSPIQTLNDYLNQTLLLISQSHYLLESFNDLNRFETCALYLIIKNILLNQFQFEDNDTKANFLSKYLRIISRILFHSSKNTIETIVVNDFFNYVFDKKLLDFSRQLLDFIFLFVFSFETNAKTGSKISFERISAYLKQYLTVFFDSMEEKEFIKILVLIHIPNMYLDTNINNHHPHKNNKFLEELYSNNNPHKEKYIEKIERSIGDIALFLFSDLGLFNQSNQIMVNGCYALIDKIFKWTKVGYMLLKESFGKLKLSKFAYVDELIHFYQKELDFFTKFEMIDLIEDIKRIEKEYKGSYSFASILDNGGGIELKGDNDDDNTIESKNKKNGSKQNKKKHSNNSKKNKDKDKDKSKIDDETLQKEQYAFVSNFLYSLSHHLVFVLNRLQPVFNILLNKSLYQSRDNIQYVIGKLWKLLQSSIAFPAIKSVLMTFFKRNTLTSSFSKEFSELMYLQINNSNELFNSVIEQNPSLLSKFNLVLSEQMALITSKPNQIYELFDYYGFIIIKILFYIILNDQISQDDIIVSVENLISILRDLSNINYEELTRLLITLLKTNYSNENLHKLLSIHLSKSSEREFILICNEILEYEFIAKTTLLKIIDELNLSSIKKYQSLQYKIFVLLYEDNEIVADLACIIWNKYNMALSDSFPKSEVFELAFRDHREKDAINIAMRSYVHLKPHLLDSILTQYKSFYETEVEEQRDDEDNDNNEDKEKKRENYIHKRHILLDFINETLELFSNEKKKALLDYLMQVSDKEFKTEIFNKTNATIFNIINSIEDKNIIENILVSIESQLKQTNSKSDKDINYNNLRIILMMLNSILVSTLHDEKFNNRKEMIFDLLLLIGSKICNREILYLIYKNIEYVSCDIKAKSEKSFDEIIAKLTPLTTSIMVNFGDIYILSGLIKCFGISSYKTRGIDKIILSNMEKKKSNQEKINAMYMITILFETLKKLYEPYFVQIFSQICELIADKENKVREKAQECLKGMMKEISGYGVNQIMPSLIKDLHIINWKSKVANIEILGQFAFCAPKQLTIYIPKVIKEIMQVLKDPHPKVQETAVSVLHDIASAIKNPEIVEISPILINAISNPFEYSNNALDALLETEFKHYLDPPSLALIIPLIDYNLKSQNDQLKRMSSHVIGSIQMLVSNPNDLIQYSDIIVPNLKSALFDSNPSCRNSIAKAIGALTKSLGKSYLEDMLKWIVQFLEKDSETVQRSGAAQAYAEIIVSFGEAYLDKCFVHLISKIQEKDPIVIEGYLSIFVFLPGCLGEKFEKYFGLIFPLIIEGFSNESENVRNVSNKILEICIKLFARKNTKQLVEPLVSRLFAPNWRIRNSSIALVKTLIMNLNKEFFKETSDYFQKEQRDQILTMTFILKSDQCGNTGTIANMIWRDYVDNITKYLSKILVLIYEQIIELLSSKQDETIEIAECSVKLLASKFSDKFFMELLPVIKETIIEKKDQERIVDASFYILIVAVTEISEKLLTSFKDKILKIINENLFTQFSSVRKQIAIIIYEISKKLNDHHINRTLIYNVMKQARGKPCDEQKKILEIVAALVEISKGEVINYAIGEIFRKPYEEGFLELGTMISEQIAVYYNETFEIKNLYGHLSEAFFEFPAHAINTIVSITEKLDDASLILFIDFIEKIQGILEVKIAPEANNSKTSIEYYFSEILVTFCNMTQQRIIDIVPSLVERATLFLVFPNVEITKNVGVILKNLVEKTDKSPDVDTIIKFFINALELVNKRLSIHHSDEEINTLFTEKFKLMIENLLYVIQNGLLYGNEKQLACDLINNLITYSEKQTLKPFIMKIVGPIIRILSEKITPQIKESLMDNVKSLIIKSKEDIKNISPQLQSVLLKTLTDTSSSVNCERYQIKAGENIIRLLQYYPRADVTANDLLKSITNKIEGNLEINSIFEMEILSDVIRFYGKVLKPSTLDTHFSTIENWLNVYPQIPYDSIVVLLSSYTAHISNKRTELKLGNESHQRLFNFISLFNGELVHIKDQKEFILNSMKTLKKDDAIIMLKPLGKTINKYRSYRDFNEENFDEILKYYEEIVKVILLKTNLLTPTKEIPDANLCLFILSLGNMKVYDDSELTKKVFAYILKLIELSKLNLQLLVSCLSLIILKEIKLTPDRDEIMMKLENITTDEKEIDIVDSFLKKIYYLGNI